MPLALSMMNNGEVVEISLINIFKGVFLHNYYFTFWYLQDLIILTALSPALLTVLRNRCLCIAFIAGLFLANTASIDLIIVKTTSLMFFILGSYISIYEREYFENDRNNAMAYLSCFTLFAIVRYYRVPFIEQIGFFASPILLWKGIDLLIPMKKLKEPKWFVSQTFFIYASHVIPVTIIGHLLSKVGGYGVGNRYIPNCTLDYVRIDLYGCKVSS